MSNTFFVPAMSKRVEFINLVPDGSFEDVANNWNVWLADPTDASQAKDGSRSLRLGGDALAATRIAIKPVRGHKYYGREYIKTAGQLDAADCRFEICGQTNGVEDAFVFGWNRGNFPNWTAISNILTIDHETGDSFGIRTFTVSGTVSAWVDSIVVIDLTSACGAGNEPSKEWCDANIPFFNGVCALDVPLASPAPMSVEGLTIPVVYGDYTRLEYAESTGGQYIDTGVVYSDNDKFLTELQVVYNTSSPDNQIMGFNGHAGMGIGSAGATFWECGNHPLAANTHYALSWHKEGFNWTRTINGSTYSGTNGNTGIGWAGNLLLFAATTSAYDSSINYYCHCKLYGAKIYKNDVLVRNFVPCKTSAGEVGMYDLVGGKFYANGGSGALIGGQNYIGTVTQIADAAGRVLWQQGQSIMRYVSLGDSIAAGHTINSNWEKDYGYGSQYGENGNASSVVVPGCYTDLLRTDFEARYSETKLLTTSFAHSGDTVADLMEKLDHASVRATLTGASIVTISIGANDVLQPAMANIGDYIWAGDLSAINSKVETNLAILANDTAPNSYWALFNKLYSINPNAKYVFTTIYNPYKYLYAEEGSNGFFRPLLGSIPDMDFSVEDYIGIDVPLVDLTLDIDGAIKSALLDNYYTQTFFSRANGLSAWSEKYVTSLNDVLRAKISAFGKANFMLADTKAVFDPVPDRPISSPKNYNDLVNVEFTRGFDYGQANWGAMFGGKDPGTFWGDLAWKYLSFSNAFPSTNVWDYVSFDAGGFVWEVLNLVLNRVFLPDADPHPEAYGHHALAKSFLDALGFEALPRRTIAYNAGTYGAGSMAAQTVVALDNMTAYSYLASTNAFTPGATGYYYTGLNTAADGSGTAYSNGQFVGLSGDLTLYAQWSNLYTVVFRHSYDSSLHGSGDTGPQECYALWINGAEQSDLGAFSNSARTYRLPYGTPVGAVVSVKSGSGRSYITLNGATVSGQSSSAAYTFTVTGNMEFNFEWNYFLSGFSPQSYWNCYVTTY